LITAIELTALPFVARSHIEPRKALAPVSQLAAIDQAREAARQRAEVLALGAFAPLLLARR